MFYAASTNANRLRIFGIVEKEDALLLTFELVDDFCREEGL